MSNPMKYIKDLEAAGFQRNQAEAQVQMVLDAIEGDLATKNDILMLKNDFSIGQERVDVRLEQAESRLDARIDQMDARLNARMDQMDAHLNARMDQMDARLNARMDQMDARLNTRIDQLETRMDSFEERMARKFVEFEFRIVTRLGLLMVSCTTIAVALLTWLIKI